MTLNSRPLGFEKPKRAMMMGLESWDHLFSIVFNTVASLAAITAAWQYIKISRGLEKHTELDISVRPLSFKGGNESSLIEISVFIKNASIRNTTFFHLLTSGESVDPISLQCAPIWIGHEHIDDRDEYIRLHAGTTLCSHSIQSIPAGVKCLKVTALLPYSEARVNEIKAGVDIHNIWGNEKGQEFNQVTRWFGPAELFGPNAFEPAQQSLPPDDPAAASRRQGYG